MLGSVSLTGCAKDGKDGKDGIDGIQGVQGEQGAPGEKGEPGIPGTDGATWISGINAPVSSMGKVGDFYYDTKNDCIYNKDSEGWKLVTQLPTLEVKPSFSPGLYVLEERISDDFVTYTEINVTGDYDVDFYNIRNVTTFEEGTTLEDMGLIPVEVNGLNVVLDTPFNGREAITLDPNITYHVDNKIRLFFSEPQYVGSIKGDLTVVDMEQIETKNNSNLVSDVKIINEEIFMVDMSGAVQYYKVKGLGQSGGSVYNTIEKIFYVGEEHAPLVYGAYNSKDGDIAVMSKDYLLLNISDKKYTLSYEFTGGTVEGGYFYLEAGNEDAEFSIALDLHTREFSLSNASYNFVKTYYNEELSKDLVITKNGTKYYASYDGGTAVAVDVYDLSYYDSEEESSYTVFDRKYIISSSGDVNFIINWLDDTFDVAEIQKEDFVGNVVKDTSTGDIFYVDYEMLRNIEGNKYSTYVSDTMVEVDLFNGTMSLGNYTLEAYLDINLSEIVSNVYTGTEWEVTFELAENGSITSISFENLIAAE